MNKLFLRLQEIQTGVRETVKSFIVYDEWAVALKQLFAKYGYYLVGAYIYIRIKLKNVTK